MTKKNLLCLAVGSTAIPETINAAVEDWEVYEAVTLAEARRHLKARPLVLGVLLVEAHDEPLRAALDDFLHEHWHMHWVAALHAPALESLAWRQLVHDHCGDYHTWPLDIERLRQTLGHAYGLATLCRAPPAPRHGKQEAALTGQSAAIARLRRQIGKVANASAPVLIWGESGSGKELAAQAVHAHSPRRDGPFVPINCGAIPASLIQSELFGYERGAFTGAAREKRGLIETAQGGSIFLDEIGDLPMELQANLLRFLQEKTIYRLGSTRSIAVDVRVIAASHVNLAQAVERGAFREDLYYRLAVLALDVPPLRERREDLLPLAEHFFNTYASERAPHVKGFSGRAAQAMRDYDWPGNVRELLNRVRRAMVMAEGRLILPQDLGLSTGRAPAESAPLDDARIRAERDAIDASLLRAGRNITLAARDLGVSRMTLYRLLAKHGIRAPSRSCYTASPASK
ncbi:sigma-54-dependent Fis family transcriptional regulator [Rugamonas sp. FT107W]|uniref:Sigma-54-dependent Fis family transcriptional regulator n=1 Tax=Duganella vulcania TaxID=2692166 RepID=A0A845HTA5_9BURK|nr:sigma-54 dependent transcriptional regulator [Duganella vulcania]MYN19606.1 sigma-54-dependent Fis family transcriptional regulator [Duganella vulcania]